MVDKNYKKLTNSGELLSPKLDPEIGKCNARQKDGKYCDNIGCDPEKPTRCKLHGGHLKSGRPPKKFLASEYVHNDLVKIFEDSAEADPDALFSLDAEIITLRGHFYSYLHNPTIDPKTGLAYAPDPGEMKKFCDAIAKLIELKAKLSGTIKSGTQKNIQIIISYVNTITKIIERHVPDIEMRKRIASDMKSLNVDEVND